MFPLTFFCQQYENRIGKERKLSTKKKEPQTPGFCHDCFQQNQSQPLLLAFDRAVYRHLVLTLQRCMYPSLEQITHSIILKRVRKYVFSLTEIQELSKLHKTVLKRKIFHSKGQKCSVWQAADNTIISLSYSVTSHFSWKPNIFCERAHQVSYVENY